MKTHWEQGYQKSKNPTPFPLKEERYTPDECLLSLLIAFIGQSFLLLFLAWANGRGTNFGR
jgi:hypothetical protein